MTRPRTTVHPKLFEVPQLRNLSSILHIAPVPLSGGREFCRLVVAINFVCVGILPVAFLTRLPVHAPIWLVVVRHAGFAKETVVQSAFIASGAKDPVGYTYIRNRHIYCASPTSSGQHSSFCFRRAAAFRKLSPDNCSQIKAVRRVSWWQRVDENATIRLLSVLD